MSSSPTDTLDPPPAATVAADRSDEALMLAYAEGDTGAFDTLYARHEIALYRFVRRLLGAQAAEGDEVFQEAWVRIVAARDGFARQSSAWRTWAFAFVCGLALDRVGASGRPVRFVPPRGALDIDADGDEDERPDVSAEVAPGLPDMLKALDEAGAGHAAHAALDDAALWRAAGRRLLEGLNGLPAEQRAMLLLRHDQGFTTPMLVDTLGLPVDAVRSGLRHGAVVLHACLEGRSGPAEPHGSPA